ncbi:hypothetical protein BaRGS_00018249 [Batillaria attramentaria]|uniref:G-protein coupled receptors family 1 profile domain-containing protein n=1 Tax=Batillaria attramentaria TaxID=370345 RepID=A0ABD0KTB3_9CAEN
MRQVVVIACMIVLAVCERAFVADYAARGYRTCVSGGEEAKKEFVTTVRAFTAISFLPLLALVVCIVFLVRALRRTKEMNNPVMRRSRARAKRKITVMVVCVSATSALAYTMIQVTNFAVYRFEQRPSKSPMLAALAVTKDFAVVFAVSVNVFFYSFFSENFRDTVKKFWSDVLSMGRTVGQCLSRN